MIIGIDIGGTSIKAGVVRGKEVVKLERVKTPKEREEFIHAVINVTNSLYQEYKHHNIKGIGVGCPGPLNTEHGVILKSPNLPKFTELGRAMRNNFEIPIVFENDANCFTLGEAVYGEGKEQSIILGITLGTGFGAGLTISKTIYNGKGNALEIGHTIINCDEEEQLPNLVKGCVEQYVSTAGILAAAKKHDLEVKEPLDVFQLATVKNEKALAIWKQFGYYLGIALTNCIHAFDPNVIVIGGQMNQAWLYFEEAMHAAIEQHCIGTPPKIHRASLKDGGIIGASLLIK